MLLFLTIISLTLLSCSIAFISHPMAMKLSSHYPSKCLCYPSQRLTLSFWTFPNHLLLFHMSTGEVRHSYLSAHATLVPAFASLLNIEFTHLTHTNPISAICNSNLKSLKGPMFMSTFYVLSALT